MKIFAHLRDTVTGDQRVYEYETGAEYLDNQPYLWGQGNYSCDCNRSLFLWGLSLDDDRQLPCGPLRTTPRIVLDGLTDESGDVLYRDEVAA